MNNQFPTKDNLTRCGVLNDQNILFVGGCEKKEYLPHLFLHWSYLLVWIDVQSVFHSRAQQFEGLLNTNKKTRLKHQVIWLACIWII